MPVLEETPAPSVNDPDLTEFPAFTFPPPPAKPGQVALNRFVLYETKTRFFIVGTNAPAGTRFRVLKIDRTTAPDELSITEDEAVYTKAEVDDLLEMIAQGNKSTGGMREIAKFYGIVGFVRFTEGYYISLITKRSPVALIGGHYIFHIDATSTISIHSSTTPTSKLDKNSDEARYLQMFQMVDLTKNFYFSYSYDITRTLQWNMTRNPSVEGRNRMFVWNQYLLENAFGQQTGIENQWALPIMYGFVDQSKLSILGRNVFVTLIARRSRFFAGARFLKRGVNDRGYVANDVETEQIVSEMSTTSFYGAGTLNANPNHTSFVQHRGSIPLYWTQDGTNMSPKPKIELNVIDPYFSAAALHFDDMFKRYGTPCIVLNLIKAKEKTPRESLLLKEFADCIEYLNQFLPEDKKIWHIKWDMSRASKSLNENVISVLEIIADKTFAQTGFFHSGFNQESTARHNKDIIYGSGLQNGVVRTNCIDCLDRTNAAQFVIAKCALGHQLYSLGLIAEPVVPFDCDVVNMLTEMYHDHGDTIALQYGGSHLVNTMETYRKINQWTSHSRDMLESIRRFYSNSFVDAEKQDAMNLFLGNYRVRKGVGPALWELPGDYHLHNTTDPELKKVRKSYIRWWSEDALLPQEALARKSFMAAKERDLERFQINDGGYDDYVGPFPDEFGENSEYFDQELVHGQNTPQDRVTPGLDRDNDCHDEDSAGHLSEYNSNLRQRRQEEDAKDRQHHHHHVENLRSDDEDDSYSGYPGSHSFGSTSRMDSMDSMLSGQSNNRGTLSSDGQGTVTEQTTIRRSSLSLPKFSSTQPMINASRDGKLTPSQQNLSPGSGSGADMRVSQSNPNLLHSSLLESGAATTTATTITTITGESHSGRESSQDGSMLDFNERIVAPLNMMRKDPRSSTAATLPESSSSSVSSMLRYQQGHLRNSTSRSSLAISSISGGGGAGGGTNAVRSRGSVQFTKGERYVYDGFDVCDDLYGGGEQGSDGLEEYWNEYYRPKVQTSFQRLFAYNMNSSSRYIPPNVKNTSEQSPFEVRQNHSIPSQAEINAKAAAKSEKSSMLSWLGLTGSSSSSKDNNNTNGVNNNKNRASNAKSGSKTLPLSTGRKKGILAGLDEDTAFQEKSNGSSSSSSSSSKNGHRDGVAQHARGSRLSLAILPSRSSVITTTMAGIPEYDEKSGDGDSAVSVTGAALRAQNEQRQHGGQDGKVRLPAHIPRSKEEEFALTKNVWTNLPRFAIHEASFVPEQKKKGSGEDAAQDEKARAGNEATTGKDGVGATVATNGASEVGGRGRSHLEEMVRRSLMPEVATHETKEYKRYTQQFKSIKFDSVSTKGTTLYGINAHSSQRNEWPASTTANPGSAIQGLYSLQQQQQLRDNNGTHKEQQMATDSSASTARPSLNGLHREDSSASTTTIGTTELNEEEEFYYAVSRAGQTSLPSAQNTKGQVQISPMPVNGDNSSSLQNGSSPLSPIAVSPPPLSPNASGSTFTLTSPSITFAELQRRQKQEQTLTSRNDFSATTSNNNSYLPEPPILLAPVQTTIKPPSESEMVLYNAHVELPKLTLYTVGQTSLNPYWGASSGTRARYDAYMMWILKGRYGNMTMPTNPTASGHHTGNANATTNTNGGHGHSHHDSGVATGNVSGSGGPGYNTNGSTGAVFIRGSPHPLRRGSSAIYPTVGESNDSNSPRSVGVDGDVSSPTTEIMTAGRELHQQHQLQQQLKQAQSGHLPHQHQHPIYPHKQKQQQQKQKQQHHQQQQYQQ